MIAVCSRMIVEIHLRFSKIMKKSPAVIIFMIWVSSIYNRIDSNSNCINSLSFLMSFDCGQLKFIEFIILQNT